jgi:hypothetical protein
MSPPPSAPGRPAAEPKSRRRSTLLTLVILAALLGGVVLLTLTQARYECVVRMEYKGGTEVRKAASATREDSIRSAVSSACAMLASGMADSMSCTRTPPQHVDCREL